MVVPTLTMGGRHVRAEQDDSYSIYRGYPSSSPGHGPPNPVPAVMYGGMTMMPMYMPPAVIAPRELPPYVSRKKPVRHAAPPAAAAEEEEEEEEESHDDTTNDNVTSTSREKQSSSDGSSTRVCQFFVKNGSCAYGNTCKFQHPLELAPPVFYNSFGLPRRSGEPPCKFFLKYRRCAYGHTCRYDHPEIINGNYPWFSTPLDH